MTAQAARSSARRLIVNADDFGQSAGINEGIIRCYQQGILTSASLMVRWPHAPAAAEYARGEHTLSVGLHVDLGEWVYQNGEWDELYTVISTDDPAAVRAEVLHQLETFRALMGSSPTHLDSHQHVHSSGPAARIVDEVGRTLGVPVRQRSEAVRYDGSFYGQGGKGEALSAAITVERLIGILRALPAGTTELGCHPGLRHDTHGMYIREREQEVHVLCDQEVRRVLDAEGIELISFRDLISRS